MQYVLTNNEEIVFITSKCPYTGTPAFTKIFKDDGEEVVFDNVIRQCDFETFVQAEAAAKKLTEVMGRLYIPTTNGEEGRRARYEVVEVPAVGDEVSRGFNGDYYPCGKIVRVTKALTVIAEDENGFQSRFRRVKQTGSWKLENMPYYLVFGRVDERSPHF